jgi:signal transduction histidine kinase/CheY-like chemotaxis protein
MQPPERDSCFSEDTLRLCFEQAPVGLGFFDQNLRGLRANAAFCKILTDGEYGIEGTPLTSILRASLPVDAAGIVESLCRKTLLSGAPHTLQGLPTNIQSSGALPLRVADWEVRRIQATPPEPLGLLLTITDVTQQKLAQGRLRLLASVLESTPDLVAILSPSGEVLYLNKAAREATQKDPDSAPNSLHVRDFQPEWAATMLSTEGFPSALAAGNWEGETAFITAEGGTIPVSQILCAHKNEVGEIEFFSTILRDISEALDIREQLARAHEQFKITAEEKSAELAAATAHIREQALLQTETANAAKNTFLSRISHELRTPLNAILGFTQLLKLESPSPAQTESIGHITRAGRHLLLLINELLDIAQIESGRLALNLEPLELNTFLRNCVEMMRPIASSSSVDLQFIARDRPFYATGDRLRLKQVVLNFLSNAIKYNNEGGIVLISLRMTPSRVRFEVRDTGPGIPLEKRSLLFKPFERLGAESSEIEGSGIGLALCKGLIDAMGGAIGLDNPDGGGCVFWAELPFANPSEYPHSRVETTLPVQTPTTLRTEPSPTKILVVDSQDLDLQFLEKLLQKRFSGAEVLSAMQGTLGLELAREHHPELILLDANLPDLTPAQFLTRLRYAPDQGKPRIVLLGSGFEDGEIRNLRQEHQLHPLMKPYTSADLLRLLRGLFWSRI